MEVAKLVPGFNAGVLSLYLSSYLSRSSAGTVSKECSSFDYAGDSLVLYVDTPLQFDIRVLDILCEDPNCVLQGTACVQGNCSVCEPIPEDYSQTIFLTAQNIDGSGSLPLEGTSCTVGPQSASQPGHYTGTCIANNRLVSSGNVYLLVMTLMDHSNTTTITVQTAFLTFAAGDPVLQNTWAEWASPPIGIYHKNVLLLWIKDFMNNTVSALNGHFGFDAIVFQVDVVQITDKSRTPATLLIPADPVADVIMGYYSVFIAPLYTGSYVATITANLIPITNSPLSFEVGTKYGIPIRESSFSELSRPSSTQSYLQMVGASVGTFICILIGWQ